MWARPSFSERTHAREIERQRQVGGKLWIVKHLQALTAVLLFLGTAAICITRLCGVKDILFKDIAHMAVAGVFGAQVVALVVLWQFYAMERAADPCDRWGTPNIRLGVLLVELILAEAVAAAFGL